MAAFTLFARQLRQTGAFTSAARRFNQGVNAFIRPNAITLDDLTPLGGVLTIGIDWGSSSTGPWREVAGFVANGVGASADIHIVAPPGWMRARGAITAPITFEVLGDG